MAKNVYKVIPSFFHKKYCILRPVFPVDEANLPFKLQELNNSNSAARLCVGRSPLLGAATVNGCTGLQKGIGENWERYRVEIFSIPTRGDQGQSLIDPYRMGHPAV